MRADERARRLIGAKFRLHGRDPATGLDCVGVVALATGCAAPVGYALRGGTSARWAAMLDAVMGRGDGSAGDVALAHAGAGQFHLVVMTEGGFVHADAALRRVVERPGDLPWPVVGFWRAEDRHGDFGADDGGDAVGRADRRRDRGGAGADRRPDDLCAARAGRA